MDQYLTFPKEICFGEINKQSPIIWVDGVFKLPLINLFYIYFGTKFIEFFQQKKIILL
jgi:hypothetical protein